MNHLPLNPVMNSSDMSSQEKAAWKTFVARNNVDLYNPNALSRAWSEFKYQTEGVGNPYMRASGLVGAPSTDYHLYNQGPYSWQDEDLVSDVLNAGSPLTQWLPMRKINDRSRYVTSTHLEWIAPAGWDGQAYSTYLADLDISDCEYGPSTKWNGFQYQQTYGQMSFKTETFNRLDSVFLQYDYERSPKFRFVRGPMAGMSVADEVDFQIGILAKHFQQHHEWVLNYGSLANNPKEEFDGLDTILTNGYVSANLVPGSTGTPSYYSDPLIVDGTLLGTMGAFVSKVRSMIRTLRNRATKRTLQINQGDMVIRMPLVLWQQVAEYLAVNGQYDSITRTEVPTDAESRFDRMMANPGWMVDGIVYEVQIDDALATLSGTTVTTDVQILTREIGGYTILEQVYVDWNNAYLPAGLEAETTTGLGGIIRYGYIEENKKCFYYFLEAAGLIITRSQPNQGVITSFSFTIDADEEIESQTYTDQYYANGGTPGSIGVGAQ